MGIKIELDDACACFSKRPFQTCCGLWLAGKAAPDPEALMRSRFAAYALGNVGYIMRTTHAQSPHVQRPQKVWRQALEAFCRQTDFLGLQILQAGETQGGLGWVTFRATLMQAGQDVSFTEKSRFESVNGRWFYHSGEFF